VTLLVAAILAALTIVLSSIYSRAAIYAKLVWKEPPKGFTAEVVLLTFLAGILLLFLGIIGEYVGRVYEETKARPHYIVGRIIGHRRGEKTTRDEFEQHSVGYLSR